MFKLIYTVFSCRCRQKGSLGKKWAVEGVLNKEMELLKTSRTFNLPRSIIKDYVKSNGKNTVEALIGRKQLLPTEEEEELVQYCLVMGHKYYGLCAKDVKCMANSLAIRYGARHPFSREKETAGENDSSCFSGDTLTCHSGNPNACICCTNSSLHPREC
jgi:hypothetical protein